MTFVGSEAFVSNTGNTNISLIGLWTTAVDNSGYFSSGTVLAKNGYGIYIDPVKTLGAEKTNFTGNIFAMYIKDITEQSLVYANKNYGLFLEKPTLAGATGGNYQFVLNGTSTGSGIWFGGTSGQRLYSNNSRLNLAGSLDIVGNLNQSSGNATINNIYGGMNYHHYTGTTLPFSASSTYYHLYFTGAENMNGFTSNNIGLNLNSSLTAQVSGMYHLTYFSVGSGINNHEYHLVPFVNTTEIENCETMNKMSATGDVVPMSGNCFVRLNAGSNVTLRIADYTGTGNGIYYGSNLNLVRIGN
jgi:hypothetical protein